jgi:hypothetical protein
VAVSDGEGDTVLVSLAFLVSALEEISALSEQAVAKAELIGEARRQGQSYLTIAAVDERPRVVELVSRMIDVLTDAGSQFRRAHARALYEEGATMEQIAMLFGVTRQRVSAVLRPADNGGKLLAPPVRAE